MLFPALVTEDLDGSQCEDNDKTRESRKGEGRPLSGLESFEEGLLSGVTGSDLLVLDSVGDDRADGQSKSDTKLGLKSTRRTTV
jgi:hypothetical protein